MSPAVLAIVIVGAVVVLAIIVGALTVKRGLITMSEALTRLTEEVAQTRAASASAIALISGLAGQIRENAEDPDALNALADQLDADQASIAEAVTANTPAAPIAADEEPAPEGGAEQQEEQQG